MPGSRPGERRGGRQKGTTNKANAEKQIAVDQALALAFAEYSHEFIDNLRPAQLQLIAMRAATKAGFIATALIIAKEVAPYYDARLAPLIVEPPPEPEEAKAKRLHDAMKAMQSTVGEAPENAASSTMDKPPAAS